MKKAIEMAKRVIRLVQLAYARRRAIDLAIRELDGSSDRALHDMGITRGDIRAVAYGTYRT